MCDISWRNYPLVAADGLRECGGGGLRECGGWSSVAAVVFATVAAGLREFASVAVGFRECGSGGLRECGGGGLREWRPMVVASFMVSWRVASAEIRDVEEEKGVSQRRRERNSVEEV
ncbi:hypothetical protein RIF29_29397 [Crotalaria pallida]|uniref:Uncharacterized protein n=1 Tax=Crotalaria pallida TaxID=3830 RepID=A0AAN9HTW1_CROPI